MGEDLCLNTDFFTDKTRPKYTSQPFTLHCNKKFIHASGDHHWSRQNIRLVRTVSILFDFYPSKKVTPPLIRVEKKFLQNWACRVSKEAEFGADFKSVRSLEFGKREKFFYRKTKFLGTWKVLQLIVLLRKNLWELLDARVLHIFEISAKFRFF